MHLVCFTVPVDWADFLKIQLILQFTCNCPQPTTITHSTFTVNFDLLSVNHSDTNCFPHPRHWLMYNGIHSIAISLAKLWWIGWERTQKHHYYYHDNCLKSFYHYCTNRNLATKCHFGCFSHSYTHTHTHTHKNRIVMIYIMSFLCASMCSFVDSLPGCAENFSAPHVIKMSLRK